MTFDSLYIAGTLSLAVASGWLVISKPELFVPVFVLNGWLLGYHHVVSTYTRLAGDSESLGEHRFLITWLPLIVLGAVVLFCAIFGVWILATGYLYWQWWHYTRQSYGVSRIYARKAGLNQDRLTRWTIYAVPLTGILYRSYQAPSQFLFTEIKVIPVPFWLVAAVGSLTAVLTVCWLGQQVRDLIRGELAVAHFGYVSSHIIGFTLGYILISDINFGWLVLNIWHNSQYLMTVWMFNNNRFRSTVSRPRLLSYLSQNKNAALYFATTFLISTAIYSSLNLIISSASSLGASLAALPLVAVVYQAINFHHYIVDALIWKVRKKSLRTNLGIAG